MEHAQGITGHYRLLRCERCGATTTHDAVGRCISNQHGLDPLLAETERRFLDELDAAAGQAQG